MVRAVALRGLFLVCWMVSGGGGATGLKDVQIGVRVVDFLVNPLPQHSRMAIVFDSRNRESRDDSRAILAWVSGEEMGTKTVLDPFLLDVRDLEASADVPVCFLSAGTEASYDAIADVARRHRILTISADLACVRSARCTIGVSSVPRVEVLLSRKQSQESGVAFSEAFRMMVAEY
jgi:hypothetical protein